MLSQLLLWSEYTIRAMREYKLKAKLMSESELFIAVNGGMNVIYSMREQMRKSENLKFKTAYAAAGGNEAVDKFVNRIRFIRNEATHEGSVSFDERYEMLEAEDGESYPFAYSIVTVGRETRTQTHTATEFFEMIEALAFECRNFILAIGDEHERLTGSRAGLFDRTPYWLSENDHLSSPLPD